MVAQLLRLRALEFLGRFRGGRLHVAGGIAALVWAIVLGALGAWVFASLDGLADATRVHRLATVFGAALLLGCFLVPLGRRSEDPLDPRRFALFGPEVRPLAAGTWLSSLLGLPALGLVIVLVGFIGGAATGVGPTIVAILAAILALATCLLVARIGAACGSLLVESPRLRAWLGLAGVVVVLGLIGFVVMVVIATPAGFDGVVAALADTLAFTPLGAVWSLPGVAVAGEWGWFAVQLLIALGTLAVGWLAWERVVERLLGTPGHVVEQSRPRGLGWFGALPASPAGAVAARSLSYFGRDPRYWVSLAIIPFAPVLLVLPLAIAGVPNEILVFIPVPVMCLLLGWSVHNDTANDHTAIWLHVAAGVPGAADRLGRVVPLLVLGVIVIIVGSPISVILLDEPETMPAVVGIGSALLLGGLGLGSIASAWLPYPAAKPGDGAFQQPQTAGSTPGFVQAGTMLLTVAAAAAPLVLTYFGVENDQVRWYFAALFAGISTGLFVLVAGILIGGAVFDRRGPEILQAALRA
ncbi:hypothetical protein [Agromyces seonyuensis]|uniref:Uncharacterized protein n=1 Tax=Agromyces seonyuensis TaxID=2662446 RepID=A0A6I4NXI2_9MICO|nr:hypothetical protein [Agromyces seonyuensis]MWB99050.1 hypothetical protein [Agromyces seonyuensis]